jgi:choline dehydrogenase-like flavoprotein
MQKERVLNSYIRMFGYHSDPGTREAMLALQRSALRPFSNEVVANLRSILNDPQGVANEVSGKLNKSWKKPFWFDCVQRVEQAPNPNSRVVLSSRRNALGQREADLDWQINALDLRTVSVARDIFVREMSALGLGRVQLLPIERRDIEAKMEGTHHQMGTTRMAQRPEDGVVDFDGRVHGMDKLYIAGSSVFPHPGDSGPTLTLMAMALRLGDHLLGRFA